MPLKDLLLRLLTEKRSEDWEQLFRDHAVEVLRSARWRVSCSAVADDVTQEVFLGLLSLDYERIRAKPACEGCIRGMVRDRVGRDRRKQARLRARERAYARGRSEILLYDTVDDVLDLREAISKLPVDLELLIWLRFFVGASTEEVAWIVETSDRNVRGRLQKALKLLAKRLSRSWGREFSEQSLEEFVTG